jgi:hypothetical protein
MSRHALLILLDDVHREEDRKTSPDYIRPLVSIFVSLFAV